MRITMIGHSTILLEVNGFRVLTDPWFGTFGNPAFRRIAPPALSREQLADVDLVLVSHNHWDHTDPRFFRLLSAGVPIVAPMERTWVTRLKGARTVVGMRNWETRQFGTVAVTAVPARHMVATRGFVIQADGKRAYFSGDTYIGGFFKQIGPVDVALLPVTAWRIPMTMGEAGAVEAVRALSPTVVIPIHAGIEPRAPFLRGNESPEGFLSRLRDEGSGAQVRVLTPGESCEV